MGELAQAQAAAAMSAGQQHQQSFQRGQPPLTEPPGRHLGASQRQQQPQQPPQRLMLPPTSFTFPASQPRGNMCVYIPFACCMLPSARDTFSGMVARTLVDALCSAANMLTFRSP